MIKNTLYDANTGGMNLSWRVSVRPSGAGLENISILTYIMALDICYQQFGEYMSVEDIFWY